MFEQINFVAGRRGAVVEDDFYNKLEKLNAQAGKRDKILLAHVQHICKAHDTAMRSYYQQIQSFEILVFFVFWRDFCSIVRTSLEWHSNPILLSANTYMCRLGQARQRQLKNCELFTHTLVLQ